MGVVSGVACQKIRCIVDSHLINFTLHRTKGMVVKMWGVSGMFNH
jgi:hypothetical protein